MIIDVTSRLSTLMKAKILNSVYIHIRPYKSSDMNNIVLAWIMRIILPKKEQSTIGNSRTKWSIVVLAISGKSGLISWYAHCVFWLWDRMYTCSRSGQRGLHIQAYHVSALYILNKAPITMDTLSPHVHFVRTKWTWHHWEIKFTEGLSETKDIRSWLIWIWQRYITSMHRFTLKIFTRVFI